MTARPALTAVLPLLEAATEGSRELDAAFGSFAYCHEAADFPTLALAWCIALVKALIAQKEN